MTNAITTPYTRQLLVGDADDKDTRSRLGLYADWLSSHSRQWHQPDLTAYMRFLLDERHLEPATVRAHLSAIRRRYQKLLRDRDLLYALAPSDLDFVGAKAFVDELHQRIDDAIHPDEAKVKVKKQQDVSDLLHIRMTPQQARQLIEGPGTASLAGMRDTAIIALMLCTGIREAELTGTRVADLEDVLDGERALNVASGKGKKARLVPYGELDWCLSIVYAWMRRAGITDGPAFRRVHRDDRTVGKRALSTRAIQQIIGSYPIVHAGRLVAVRPHDLRRTYARRLYEAGVDPVKIKQNMGHVSLQTTLHYIGEVDGKERRPPEVYDVPTGVLKDAAATML